MGADRRGRSIWRNGAVVVCLALSLVTASAAAAAQPPEYVSSFGPDGSPATGFGKAGPVAVDQSLHVVYVLDIVDNALFKFDIDGAPVPFTGSAGYISGNEISGLALSAGSGQNQAAVDSASGRIYVTSGNAIKAFEANGEPALFSAGPGAGTNEIAIFTTLQGVAVDENGAIYVADFDAFTDGENITIFDSAGAVLAHLNTSVSIPVNLAVDTLGTVYVQEANGKVVKYVPSQFPVSASTIYPLAQAFGSNLSLTVSVDPATDDVYIAESGAQPRIARFSAEGALLSTFAGSGEEGEIEESQGIGIDGDSTRVFVADSPAVGLSQVEIFQPLVAAPTIEQLFVTQVTGDTARLGTEINPNTRGTDYQFEYGLADCSGGGCSKVPATPVEIGAGHDLVSVSEPISGLAPSTTYHYRVLSENDLGVSTSQDQTFTTQGVGVESRLSDSRVWELVSPASKLGGILVNASKGPMQAAEDGNSMAYQSLGSIEGDAEGNRAIERSTVISKRVGAAVWSSQDITPPHEKPTLVGAGNEYNVLSSDLSRALLETRDDNPLSPQASSKTPYLRLNSDPPTYLPLVTSKNAGANVPPGTDFGGKGKEITVSGATSNLDHLVLRSEAPLVPGAEGSSLYAWSDGQLETVSALPAIEGGAVVKAILGTGQGSTRHAVAEDGSRVFWSQGSYDSAGIGTTALYLRDLDTDETVRLDVVQPGASGAGEPRPAFQGASEDGSIVFFSDSQQLTEDASPEGRDLYRCVISNAVPPQCILTNLTASTAGPGESAAVQGLVSGLSEDGSAAYFVAEGVLNSGTNQAGDSPAAGKPNLYAWTNEEGVSFVVSLSSEDFLDWGFPKANPFSFYLSTSNSSDGRYFTFMSVLSLTGYDNRDAATGLAAQEVFLYDAEARSLKCISCNPTGARPKSQRIHVDAGFPIVDPQLIWQDRLVAGILPEARRSAVFDHSFYRPRAVLDNGRVFFNAVDALVPADSNGTWDVYQYEPTGVGSCTATSVSATVVRSDDACVGLVSSGTAGEEAGFLDASDTGDDVFFLTPGRLSAFDKDTVYDVYDARVNGVAAVLSLATECTGEACQPQVGPPNDPTPSSEAFRGPGNQRFCPKGKRKVKRNGRVRCVPHKHHKKKQKQRRRAGQTRGATR